MVRLPVSRDLTALTVVAVVLTITSCSDSGVDYGRSDQSDYPTLQGQFAEEGVTEPLVAVEAFLDGSQFYVRYQSGEKTFYAGGEWANRIDLTVLQESAEPVFLGPFILPLGYQQIEPWEEVPGERITPRILDAEHFVAFRKSFLDSIVPTDEKLGIVMHFDVDDYFLYINDVGEFEARVLQDKPADYSYKDRVTFQELVSRGVPYLEAFLNQRGITDRRVVFNTGDAGRYSLPFFYVNLDLHLAVFVRYEPPPKPMPAGTGATPIAQTLGHVIQSHGPGIVVRPVSSLYRLFFVAADTAIETVRPEWMVSLESGPIAPLTGGPGMDLVEFEKQLDLTTGRTSSKGTIEYLIDGEEFFTRFIDAVTSAQESILLRTYIFDNDDYAKKIGELLKRRSNEGVDVNLLFDGIGTIVSTVEKQETLPEGYAGPASVREFLESDSNIDVRQATNPWLTGDHVKTVVIDNQTAFTGGMNIAREYRYDWHDLMMEVHGPVVDVLREEFSKAWAHAAFFGDWSYLIQKMKPNRRLAEDLGYPVRVLFTKTESSEIFAAQKMAIRYARKYIYVENAYFTDDALLYELAKARRRGVDVRVIMPLQTDRGPITRNNALAANAMLEHGIRVFIYPGMSHVKAAVFDGWACLGSANWDHLSLRINQELNLATSHPEAVDRLNKRLFEADFARSAEITEPFPERWTDHLIEVVGDYVF